MSLRVLILGGTAEGRELAAACAGEAALTVVSSLAGRTDDPIIPAGGLRIGGFGGAEGLAAYLRAERVGALVDATHPFASAISRSAAAAAAATGVPLLALRRPPWRQEPGDDWRRVPTVEAAAALAGTLGKRIFVTTGRQSFAAYARLSAHVLARSVEPPAPPLPARLTVVLDRGPFTLAGERALMAEHGIDVLVTKDSGGELAAAKLAAARERGIPVVVVDRPPAPAGVPAVGTVAGAAAWLRAQTSQTSRADES
ncbi:cobalt-precorrin-6A reductase [Spirilliplanes yamanashiensis]|uniref:Precorrin-6A reductase n=1 Tax=Spirilliplanes yamanashiensis TaxID=42233 RepID=A0A8J4DI82_9ACTN|nr:cobalt-precorrin-6A reductase [Spirilliplanes yamanashiensis]MDP9817515.1 precorrin-6A/cobalt-precorrin-6A reductase [Spirilliplanes yamanashiensis]GIJ02832.1 precorrin-6A reductase [Spirilliplanes yamanashiensis]